MPRCPRCQRRLADGAACLDDGETATAAASRTPGAAPAAPGVVVERPLGAGGFAVVWEGRTGEARVALKVAHAAGEVARERFRREALALQRVGPPHVPRLLGQGVLDDGRPYLLLERLVGQTLAEHLTQAAAPPAPARVVELLLPVLDSLEAIHAAGLVHRDLKPENVFFRAGGGAALVDFGLALLAGEPSLTRAGMAAGTPEYLAPEQLRGEEVSARADLYALGVILYELLTLRPPFTGSATTVQHGHLFLRPLPPGQLAPVPRALEELALACLAKEPARRPPDVAAVRRALLEAPHEAATGATKAPLPAGERAEPMVLLWIATQGSSTAVTEAVKQRGGWLARQKGGTYLAAFAGLLAEDPAGAALAAAEAILADEGGRAALHVAPVVARPRPGGLPRLSGEALDRPETWLPTGEWSGVHAGELAPAAAPAASGPLLGREAEASALMAAAGRCFEERVPALVALIGGRGVGKTRLLDEVAGARVLRVSGGARDAARELLDALGEPTRGEARLALGEALRRAAAAAPLAVLCDDAHRADDALLDALEYATWGGEDVALLVVVAALPSLLEVRPRFGLRAERFTRLSVGPLDAEAASRLAAQLLLPAEYPPATVLAQLADWTGGNPLFLTEVVRALKRAGVVRRRSNAAGYTLASEVIAALPSSSVVEWMAVRALADLPAAISAFARLCAVLGARVDRAELAAAQGEAGGVDAGVGLIELEQAGLLRREGAAHVWRNRLLCDAVYQLVPEAERVELHRRALAAAGGAEAVARHAEACGARAEAAAAHLALGDAALAGNRLFEADQRYTSALGLVDDRAYRVAALAGRGRTRYRIDRVPEAIADLSAARAEAEGALHAELLLEEATALDWIEDHAGSRARVEEARPLVAISGDEQLAVRLRVADGRSRWRAGKAAEARAVLEEAAAAAVREGDDESRIVAQLLLAPIRMVESLTAEAEAGLDEVIERCLRSGDRLHLSAAYLNHCFLALSRHSAEGGIADLRRVVQIAREDGHPFIERTASFNLAELMFWSGEERESLALARRAFFLEERFEGRVLPHTPLLAARIAGPREGARELEWLRAHADDAGWRPGDRALWRALQGPADWDALCAEARPVLQPEELLELLYRRARAEGVVGAEVGPLLEERPFWRPRFDALPQR